jgi:hypothetical protein
MSMDRLPQTARPRPSRVAVIPALLPLPSSLSGGGPLRGPPSLAGLQLPLTVVGPTHPTAISSAHPYSSSASLPLASSALR